MAASKWWCLRRHQQWHVEQNRRPGMVAVWCTRCEHHATRTFREGGMRYGPTAKRVSHNVVRKFRMPLFRARVRRVLRWLRLVP